MVIKRHVFSFLKHHHNTRRMYLLSLILILTLISSFEEAKLSRSLQWDSLILLSVDLTLRLWNHLLFYGVGSPHGEAERALSSPELLLLMINSPSTWGLIITWPVLIALVGQSSLYLCEASATQGKCTSGKESVISIQSLLCGTVIKGFNEIFGLIYLFDSARFTFK